MKFLRRLTLPRVPGLPRITLGLAALLLFANPGTAQQLQNGIDFETQVQPLMRQLCFDCHNAKKQKGDVRLDDLNPDMLSSSSAESWALALEMLEYEDMPPRKKEQPSTEQRQLMMDWMSESLAIASAEQKKKSRTIMRRLNKQQYTYTLQELLDVGVDFGQVLPDEAKSKTGFSNNGEVLEASSLHLEYYQSIARQALDLAIVSGPKPAPIWYRVRFGKGIGKGKVAGRTGGYQSVPVATDDFLIDILTVDGKPKVAANPDQQKEFDAIKKHISVGLRGSSQSRFRVVEDGVILYSALPHREVAPGSWQGPSPNLKLEMQRVYPENGDFVIRVQASRGHLLESNERLLIPLEKRTPIYEWREDAIKTSTYAFVFEAPAATHIKNMELQEQTLRPVDVPADSSAQFELNVLNAGYFQFDLLHPPISLDNMPSVRLTLHKATLDYRLQTSVEELEQKKLVSALGAAYIPSGKHTIKVGGRFFVGFDKLIVTPIAADHPAVAPLQARSQAIAAAVAQKTPSLRAYVGTRTDDGMDYLTFDQPQEVHAAQGKSQTYTFKGRLENLPIPEPESGDTEILSGFMLLGVWNDNLAKSSKDSGPPLLVQSIEFEAPFYEKWPPRSHQLIFFEEVGNQNHKAYARKVIRRFMQRAFRRPVDPRQVDRYLAFWLDIRDHFPTLQDSIKEVLVAVLCSPNFLYLAEPADVDAVDTGIAEHALATRLSYFLWNSPPDAKLMQLAAQEQLRAQLEGQVHRLLDSESVWRFVRGFGREWLRMDRQELITINVDRYPAYTRFVKRDMAEETFHFIHHLMEHDLSIFQFIDSEYAMLNQNLAEFYGVKDVIGNHFRAVTLPTNSGRGGLLSQGSFLAGHSDGSEAHPIKRAVWIKEKILGIETPLPPPNTPPLDPETPGFDQLTLKEKLEQHRDNPSCHDCHAGLDPFGIAFEAYNAVGMLEAKRKGRPVDDSTILPDGTPVDGVDELKQYLLQEQRHQFAKTFIEYLLAYALGRDLTFADKSDVEQILDYVELHKYSMRSAILGVVLNPAFSMK
jgi:hypothetical protein